jgi:hypothetical protein
MTTPEGRSMATCTVCGGPSWRSRRTKSANPSAECGTVPRHWTVPVSRSTQIAWVVEAQSRPTKNVIASHELIRTLHPQGVAFTTWFFFDRDSFPFLLEGPYAYRLDRRLVTAAAVAAVALQWVTRTHRALP